MFLKSAVRDQNPALMMLGNKLGGLTSRYFPAQDSRVLIRFLAVGCSNFVVSFVSFRIFLAITEAFQFRLIVAQAISYTLGIIWSFLWNKKFTFHGSGPWRKQLYRFIAVQALLGGVSALLIWMLAEVLFSLNDSVIWFAVMIPLTLVNFSLTKRYVFGQL